MKGKWIAKAIFFGALAIAAITTITMLLWNNLATVIFGLPAINFFQTLGLMVLGRLLTGGFRPRGGGFGHDRRRHMRERWMKMSAEERQQFSKRWGRWAPGCAPGPETTQENA